MKASLKQHPARNVLSLIALCMLAFAITRAATPTTVRLEIQLLTNSRACMPDRIKAVHSLSANLTFDESRAAYAFLSGHSNVEETNVAGVRYLKNELMKVLRGQPQATASLTEALARLYTDSAQDSAVRDYALQHLACWYQDEANDSSESKQRIRAVLKLACEDGTELSGTALLALQRISSIDASTDREYLNSTALRLAASQGPASVRVTALQICAERNCVASLPTVRMLARSDSNPLLKISAIAALGNLGDASDLTLLWRLQETGDDSLRPAITVAIKKLEQRNQNAF